ncbi:site-2 protease family protein [Candidatus Pacearchaeota archaeon]|nr:site-2 protease family protein [Candidatus Pacearchaeota archaeon]
MSFVIYDLIFLAIFIIATAVFLYRRRKKLDKEGLLYIYRTKVGIKFIDYIDTKYRKIVSAFKYPIIATGYVSMIVMTYFLVRIVYIYVKSPEVVRAIKIPPLAPLIPYLPSIFKVDFLPTFYFTYWIIVIAVIAISHEFAHGIFARLINVKIKSTGFGFLGPFLAAFVEPDEEEMKKKSVSDQLAVIGAGSFANIIMTIIFFIILVLFSAYAFIPAGFIFNTYASTIVNVSDIDEVGNFELGKISLSEIEKKSQDEIGVYLSTYRNFTRVVVDGKTYYINFDQLKLSLKEDYDAWIVYYDTPALQSGLRGVITNIDGENIKSYGDLSGVLSAKKPRDKITIKTLDVENKEELEFEIVLAENPQNNERGFIGVSSIAEPSTGIRGMLRKIFSYFREPNTYYKPRINGDFIEFIFYLIWWIVLINISVALVNMLPLGIFDGGRFFYLTMFAVTKNEKRSAQLFRAATTLILALFLVMMLFWAIYFFS